LEAAYRKYCGKKNEKAHSAEEDAEVSAEVLEGQLKMYTDLPRTVPGLAAFFQKDESDYIDSEGKFIWQEGEVICNFGKKYFGVKLKDIALNDKPYLQWIIRSSFSSEVKKIAMDALAGTFPDKE
jgi:DNA polymerase III subunit epsilon